jgi:hypothetical protein
VKLLQQGLLSLIQKYECGDTFELAAVMFKDRTRVDDERDLILVTAAQLASTHRALSGLAKQGLIVRLGRRFRNGRTHWCTPEYAAKHPSGEGLPLSDRALAAKIGVSASTMHRARLRVGQ